VESARLEGFEDRPLLPDPQNQADNGEKGTQEPEDDTLRM
jgi:hypothetical protein